jgi:hypothetical protein
LTHDGKRVIDLFYTSGLTHTINKMFLAKTRREIDEQVKYLGLVIDKESRVDSASVEKSAQVQIK